jgi:hypothetical protein
MEEARKTGIHLLDRFVRTLKQDLSAAELAVSKPWSNGPVEGHINRLTMLKRQMYGRAGIELLRARLLPELKAKRKCFSTVQRAPIGTGGGSSVSVTSYLVFFALRVLEEENRYR